MKKIHWFVLPTLLTGIMCVFFWLSDMKIERGPLLGIAFMIICVALLLSFSICVNIDKQIKDKEAIDDECDN